MADESDYVPLVIDYGSYSTRAGPAGGDTPTAEFRSVIGRPRQGVKDSTDLKDSYIGNEAQAKRDLLTLTYPIEKGVVTDWDAMDKISHYIYYDQLRLSPDEHPVLLTAPLNPKSNREKVTEMMFEHYDHRAVYIALEEVLSLYATARVTGIAINCGGATTRTVPVSEGHAIPDAISQLDIGGDDLTKYLTKLLDLRDGASHRSQDVDEDIKKEICYVAEDFEMENMTVASSSHLEKAFKLPDGKTITVDSERIGVPEALFQPSLIGIEDLGVHKKASASISKCDVDLRGELYGGVILSGGSSMFPGLSDRLRTELKRLAPASTPLKLVAPSQPGLSAWIGGSIFASLSTFKDVCMTKEDYDECGPPIVHKKCFG